MAIMETQKPLCHRRKFGETIRSRKRSLQYREPIVKGLIYNIHR
jgi:hypothetical protein